MDKPFQLFKKLHKTLNIKAHKGENRFCRAFIYMFTQEKPNEIKQWPLNIVVVQISILIQLNLWL